MTSTLRQRATFDLELLGSDPIAGRLTDPDGNTSEFLGWLGLARAIEALAEAIPPRAALNAYVHANVRTQLPASPVLRAS
jgi:hypothetical protein